MTAEALREDTHSPEIYEELSGVGAFIVTPDGLFWTVVEKNTRRKTNKMAGMVSTPMETIEQGESHAQAFTRLFSEEVVTDIISDPKPDIKLCQVQLSRGVWLHVYLVNVDNPFTPTTNWSDVSNSDWQNINHVHLPSNNVRFRPGVKEIIESYKDYLIEGHEFQPIVHFSCQDKISEEEFLAAGV